MCHLSVSADARPGQARRGGAHRRVALVGALLADQHPDLADRPLTEAGVGVGQRPVPPGRRPGRAPPPPAAVGARWWSHEQRWLPELAPRLPLPVPAPVRTGEPGHGYPWRWSICPWLPGRPAAPWPASATRRRGRRRSAGSWSRCTGRRLPTRPSTRTGAARWPTRDRCRARAGARRSHDLVDAGGGPRLLGRARGDRAVQRPAPVGARRPAPRQPARR